MSFTYNSGSIATSAKDAVRLLIGDTLSTDPQLQDEEIVYLISRRGTLYGAAAECCRSIAAKYSRSVDQTAGSNKMLYSQMAKAYTVKTLEFEQIAATSGAAIPASGGVDLSVADVEGISHNSVPQFTVGMFDQVRTQ